MAQQFSQQQIKTRTAVLVFIKGSAAPIVLYVENPQTLYSEFVTAMKSATPVVIEKETMGPIKKVSVISNQISGVALQDEQYV